MQETHEVQMGGLRHSFYMNFFDAWKVSLFAALTTILLLVYFYNNPYFNVLKFVRSGIVITFEVTVAAMILSLILGLLAGLGKLSNNAFIKGIASVYIEVIRGVPLLVQLFYIHFGLGRFFQLPPLGSAISAMAICYGAYMGEIFRAGIQSISHGQVEAAKSLGMTNYQTMSKVILPQGFKVILPPIGNEFIALLKDSSLVSIIAVADILRRAREYVSIYFIPFEAYTLVALVYLVITLVLSKVVWNMEKIMATDE
ncbi:MAG: amino acid ABC transporter permease [Deltaproteobacteria bacterium]|uniref:Amino acid ABC transporter permease n=1 Tax=Candidatus Zymogenus saltonus TaxID=2844893 RepID=A0A9D8KF01_9DELT|nr:amino acid ABC transporter permease [Candidatus Zymogenus saltonus]